MSKINLGIIYGGKSAEHDISIISANSIIKNLNIEKYNLFKIFIDKGGNWYEQKIDKTSTKIFSIVEYLKKLDVVFPVLHGLYGEDGTIQGMLELFNIPYVGSAVLASSLCMDKVAAKIFFEKANLLQAKYIYIQQYKDKYFLTDELLNETLCSLKEVCKTIESKIKYPMFIKPSNSGSSLGINKAHDFKELSKFIQEAAKYDRKILVEENVDGKEIECAVLGNNLPISSIPGEIIPSSEFYNFDSKYKNTNSKLIVPASISEDLTNKVKALAIKAFKATGCKNFARIDFFVNDKTNKIYINEINTIPGFTDISMYPILWNASGIPFTELLDRLINLALEKEE